MCMYLFQSFVSLHIQIYKVKKSLLRQGYRLNIKLTVLSVGPVSSMMKTPSVVILTPSRDDAKSVQPSECETNKVSNMKEEGIKIRFSLPTI